MTGHNWTHEQTDELARLWNEGLSASTIAFRLERSFVTRDAVLGKIHRLNLPTRNKLPRTPNPRMASEAAARWREQRKARAYAKAHTHSPSLAAINGNGAHGGPPVLLKPRPAPPVAVPAYAGEPKLITELPNGKGCRYAVTETTPFRFCGAPGFPWCAHHHSIVYGLS